MKPHVLILRTAGTNCDKETAHAFASLGANVTFAHINRLFKKEIVLKDFHILVLPGGFSYGDDVAAGKVLANELQFTLRDALHAFVAAGRLVIGICNGFQVLVKCGLLPGWNVIDDTQQVTLASNDSNLFECRWIHLKKDAAASPFLTYVPDIIRLPIAHGEGKCIPKNNDVLQRLEKNKQVAFRYCDAQGKTGVYPVNPNGSVNHIAALCNPQGNVLGMMPHPERFFHAHHAPDWTSSHSKKQDHGDGYFIFKSAVTFIEKYKVKL